MAPVALPDIDATTGEGYSVLQKGLFLVAVVGCVVAYMRVSYMRVNKKEKRFTEKSMA
jgi:hypothetical protein